MNYVHCTVQVNYVCGYDPHNDSVPLLLQLLSRSEFSNIEKIKTIGSTYMAAAGLQPGRESGGQQGECQKNVVGMTEFALMMMIKLEEINFNSFNQFKLRVGEYRLTYTSCDNIAVSNLLKF